MSDCLTLAWTIAATALGWGIAQLIILLVDVKRHGWKNNR